MPDDLIKNFPSVSELYALHRNLKNSRSLSNIFINFFCHLENPATSKESGQKLSVQGSAVIKLPYLENN